MDDPKTTVEDLVKKAVNEKMAEVDKKYGIGEMVDEKKAAPFVMAEKPVEPSISAARYVKIAAMTGGDLDKIGKVAKSMYPRDELLNSQIETKAAGVTIPSDGGFLVPEVLASELIMPLYNKLSVVQAGARRIPMPNGNMTIPRMDTGATVGYVGENSNMSKTQQVFGDVKLSARKLAALIPVSNDLIRSSSLAADMYIRDDLVNRMRIKMDYAALYGSGSVHEPLGLSNILAQQNSGNVVGSSSTAFTSDIPAELLGKLWGANVPMLNPAWLINGQTYSYLLNLKTTTGAFIYRDEMLGAKTLIGIPFIVSNQVSWTDDTVDYVDIFVGDFSEFLIGEQLALQIESSREAAYYDGSNTISAFQQDQTVIRAISTHDFNVRHPVSFVKGTYKLATS